MSKMDNAKKKALEVFNDIKEKIVDVKDKASSTINTKTAEIIKEAKESGFVDKVVNSFKKDKNIEIKNEILNKIISYDTIIIHRHQRPDGDCIGSALGLRKILRNTFPNKNIYSVGDNKCEYLKFLGHEDEINDEVYNDALVIVLDTATSNRIFDDRYKLGKEIIKIDHHVVVEEYGNINYVIEESPACSTIITDFYNTFKNQLKMDTEAAQALFVAMVTDTGRFRYSGVDSSTLKLASTLLEYNIDLESLYTNLYTKSKEELKIQGYLINKFKVSPNGVAYAFLGKKAIKKCHVTYEAASNTVNLMDGINGSLIWVLFIDYKTEIRVRIRSRFIDVIPLAAKFNGGGHKNACGGKVYNKKQMKELIKIADEILSDYKKEHEDAF